MSEMIYHYTDRLSAADIRRDGFIRAYPLTLHRDMFARDAGKDTVPLVWFTMSGSPDATVLAKLKLGGWPMPPFGDLYRFVLPADYPAAERWIAGECDPVLGCEPIWWQWTLGTAEMAGSRRDDWRLVLWDVPLSDVIAIEVLAAIDGEKLVWEKR